MATRTEQFITQTKLRELRKQREMLLTTYDQLDDQLASQPGDAERLQTLYSGLREIRFADQVLHPEVANLEPLLYGLNSTATATPDTVAFWRSQLEKELANGRLRSEVVFIFAALLEEWTQESGRPTTDLEQEIQQRQATLLKEALDPNPLPLDQTFLDDLFNQLGFSKGVIAEFLRKPVNRDLLARVQKLEVRKVLEKISRDQYHATDTRQQATNLLLDDTLIKEFSDALTIVLSDFDQWEWSSEGVTVRASLTPSKWRLFLNEDLPTACLLEIVALRWQNFFGSFFSSVHSFHLQQLRKTLAGSYLIPAQKVTLMLAEERKGFGVPANIYNQLDIWGSPESDQVQEKDLWDDPSTVGEGVKQRLTVDELLRFWANNNSIAGLRAELKADYQNLERFGSYSSTARPEKLTPMEQTILQVNAEVRLNQAAFPGQPLYILKADLKNYYPGLSHELVLDLLQRFGLEKAHLEFLRRYLQVKVKAGPSSVVTIKQGVPIHRMMGDWLGDLVMILLEYFIKGSARVQIIRMIDDICLIATSEDDAVKAWEALEKFCAACGLTLNRDKCGAVCVNDSAELPASLPANPPVWAMLTLDTHGEWQVDLPRFESYMQQSRSQVLSTHSLISQAEVYNNCFNYLVKALGLRLWLDDSHIATTSEAILRFQMISSSRDEAS